MGFPTSLRSVAHVCVAINDRVAVPFSTKQKRQHIWAQDERQPTTTYIAACVNYGKHSTIAAASPLISSTLYIVNIHTLVDSIHISCREHHHNDRQLLASVAVTAHGNAWQRTAGKSRCQQRHSPSIRPGTPTRRFHVLSYSASYCRD